MKRQNPKPMIGTRHLKPKKQRLETAGTKSASPVSPMAPHGSVPTPMVFPVVNSHRGINNPPPSPPTPSAPAANPVPPAETSAGACLRHFEFVAPDARTVFLAGSFNQWNRSATPMIRLAEGKWAADLLLPPGRHEYLFFVNGNNWTPDPKALDYASNPFGGYNSVLEVAATK